MELAVTSLFLTSLLIVTCTTGLLANDDAEVNTIPSIGAAILMYSWVTVDYDWPNDTMRQDYIDDGRFIVENNVITGIKVYGDEVYITVPRWRPGVPSTLNRVVTKNGIAVLQPYPSWQFQTVGDCSALQYVQSMELDPNSGLLWIIDNGRININSVTGPPLNLCPPKLVIYDTNKNTTIHSYTFPSWVADPTSCFLNDIVLHYVDGDVRFAYVTDTRDAKLYVYNYAEDSSHFFQHSSMEADKAGGRGGVPIDGIAMSEDFQFLYYCPIDSLGLFQVPTSILSDPNASFGSHVRRVGDRVSRSDGLAYGQHSIFYGLLDQSGVNQWLVARDVQRSGSEAKVNMTTQKALVRDDDCMVWVDTFGWDQGGYLWFTANDLSKFFDSSMDFSGNSGPNMYVWKVFVNESSYLSGSAKFSKASGSGIGVSVGVLWVHAGMMLVYFVLKWVMVWG